MATILRSSGAAARRLLRSISAVRSLSSRAIPAVPSSHRILPAPIPHFSSIPIRSVHSTTSKLLPQIQDSEIQSAFKDLMACNWDQIPNSVLQEAKKALNKESTDQVGKEHLKNLLRAAEACEEFSGTLVALRMALDDLSGLSGENVGPLPGYVLEAVKSAHNRYIKYLDSFNNETELYLRKKVETELGTKMIHLKMRCSGIGSEWGKISLLGTSGISGSYVELRA